MSAEARYFCPECGGPEVHVGGSKEELEARVKIAASLRGLDARCQLCGWSGKVEDMLGHASSEGFYTIEKIANILLMVTAKHAAGPLCQALEMVGLIEKDDQEGKEKVIKAVTEAMVTSAFQTAADHTAAKATVGGFDGVEHG